MLPDPTVSLSLPSLHDHLVLDCRVYHPLKHRGRHHAAIVAHPYAPLGGCYDDPMVDMVASTLLRLGFIVGTFNFRGASGSTGRTSWTSKPERHDYMSVVGFLAFYIHHLHESSETANSTTLAPVFLQAGYSYGAMITTQIPPLDEILGLFSEPVPGSAAAEIRLRAQHLASQFRLNASNGPVGRQSPRIGIRVGGDEDRRSTDARRSVDGGSHDAADERPLQKGLKKVIKLHYHRHHRSGSADMADDAGDAKKQVEEEEANHRSKDPTTNTESARFPDLSLASSFKPAYLMISPLQGVITTLATMSFLRRGSQGHQDAETDDERAERKLVENQTLALFGDQDVFVAAKRLRHWAARLEARPNSQFRAHEISSAGHFWVEDRVAYVLQEAIGTFASGLLK